MYDNREWNQAGILRTINLQGTDQGMAYVPPGIRTIEALAGLPSGTKPSTYLQHFFWH